MSRIESSDNAAALALPDICIAVAVDLDFPTGHLRLHDAIGTISFGGHSYEGSGKIDLVDKVEEGIEVVARPLRLSLSGVDASMISLARSGDYQNRSATVYLCPMNTSTQQLVDTPETFWRGKMDTIRIRLGQGTAAMDVNCEHSLRGMPSRARYTDSDQQMRYPGDRFFDRLTKIPGFIGKWGSASVWVRQGKGAGYRVLNDYET